MGKKIILSEQQKKLILAEMVCESQKFSVEPDKVLLIKKFLDKNFKRGDMDDTDDRGMPKKTPIVGMVNTNGEVAQNMSLRQLYDLLVDQFVNIYTNTLQRNKFIAQIIRDWYYRKIDNNGLLSVNIY
jgi:hypothetical protein